MREDTWVGFITLTCCEADCGCSFAGLFEASSLETAYRALQRGAMHHGWAVSVLDPQNGPNLCPCHGAHA
jgi:hypothetical protein